ncbi:MAG: hypothetical protein AB1609_17815 [Bacillota bacterium]
MAAVGRVVAVDLCNTVAAVNAAIAACLGLGAGWVWETYSLEPAGIRDAEAWFRGHPEVFAEAEPVPGAVEALDGLAATGWEIVYVTARPEWARWLSADWLRRHGFPRGRLVMTGDKARACLALGVSAAVEDAPEHIRAVSRVVPVYVPRQPYNGSRLGWPEICRALRGEGGRTR